MRLAQLASVHWVSLDGFAASRNMGSLTSLPQDRFDNFVYWWFTKDASSEQLEKFRAELYQPPKGEVVTDTSSPWHPENETNALAELKAQMGG